MVANGERGQPLQVRLLAGLVVVEAVGMVAFVVVDVLAALEDENAEWGAIWFAVVVLGLWATGLLLVARGTVSGKRWAFTPTLFTQLIFGVVAVSVFGSASTTARWIWAGVLILAVVGLRLLFSREVREHLVYSNTRPRTEE